MRNLFVLSAAASVLALGVTAQQAAAFFRAPLQPAPRLSYKMCSKRAKRKDPAAYRVRILGRALASARLVARYKIKATEATRPDWVKTERVVAAPTSM